MFACKTLMRSRAFCRGCNPRSDWKHPYDIIRDVELRKSPPDFRRINHFVGIPHV